MILEGRGLIRGSGSNEKDSKNHVGHTVDRGLHVFICRDRIVVANTLT